METTSGNLIEWFYNEAGYGFELFIGGLSGRSVTDGKAYPSDAAAIQAGLAYEASISQVPDPDPPSGLLNNPPSSPEP